MKQLKTALAAAVLVAGFAAASEAQTITYVTNAYDAKLQQIAAGAIGSNRYSAFGGEAKAVNNKTAADLKGFAFTLFYAQDATGAYSVTGGTFLIQTTNKDRSPLLVGGQILPSGPIDVRSNGWIAVGETLTLSLVGSDGTGVTGTLTVTIDKSNPPRATGSLFVTYPVVQ
jgi:hypothetical protein